MFIGKRGLRADPAKVKAIVDWTILRIKKTYSSGLALPITHTNTVKIMLVWLGH